MARGEWNAARDGQFGWLAKSAGFRRNPQEHAGTGAIRQEKTPTENGWGFVIGGLGSIEMLLARRVKSSNSKKQETQLPGKLPGHNETCISSTNHN